VYAGVCMQASGKGMHLSSKLCSLHTLASCGPCLCKETAPVMAEVCFRARI